LFPNYESGIGAVFAWHPQLNIGATAKPYFPTTDRLNVPRIDYTGGGCGSLLLEKQSTNIVTYSQDFTNAAWVKSNLTVTANYSTSIFGINNSFLLTSTGVGGVRMRNSVNSSNNTSTFFVKKGNHNFVQILDFGGAQLYANFDLNSGTIGSKGSLTTSYIQELNNGWFKISAYFNSSSTGAFISLVESNSAGYGGGNIALGQTIELSASQNEQSTYPTSYIPTLASSVTRLADTASKTGISSLIGQTQGTIFLDFVAQASSTSGSHIWITGTSGNEIGIYGNTQFIFYSSGGVSINGGGYTTGQRYKLAFAYKNNDYVAYVNGVQKGTDTSATVPATSALYVNSYSDFTEIQNKQVNQAIVFPTRLTNTQLQSLTSL